VSQELLVAYGVAFALLVGYLVYLQRKLATLEQQLEELRR
jgi:CcmD family protein